VELTYGLRILILLCLDTKRNQKGNLVADTSLARQIIQTSTSASLGTITKSGSPFVTLVSVAATSPTTVVMLLSGLAQHTKNLNDNGTCSLLLVASSAEEDVMQSARITLTGHVNRLAKEDDADSRAAFLAVNPSSALYADFGDFAFYEFTIAEAHLVAGFGRIESLSPDQL
jgi:putative heme iron utilization protein